MGRSTWSSVGSPSQDRGLELAQSRSRFEPELVRQQGAAPAQRGQRVSLTVAANLGEASWCQRCSRNGWASTRRAAAAAASSAAPAASRASTRSSRPGGAAPPNAPIRRRPGPTARGPRRALPARGRAPRSGRGSPGRAGRARSSSRPRWMPSSKVGQVEVTGPVEPVAVVGGGDPAAVEPASQPGDAALDHLGARGRRSVGPEQDLESVAADGAGSFEHAGRTTRSGRGG